MLLGAAMTLAVAGAGFLLGGAIGTLGAWAKIVGRPWLRGVADLYTTVLRGIPDLLVIRYSWRISMVRLSNPPNMTVESAARSHRRFQVR